MCLIESIGITSDLFMKVEKFREAGTFPYIFIFQPPKHLFILAYCVLLEHTAPNMKFMSIIFMMWLFFFHFRFQFQLTRFLWNTRERNSEWHIHLAIWFEWYSWKQQVIDTVLVICPKTYRSIQMKATLQSTVIVFIYNLCLCAWIGWLEVIKTKRKINKLTGNLLNQQIPLSTTTLFNDKCKQKCATLMSIWAFYAVKSETQNPFSSILLCVIHIFWKMCIASFCSSFWRSFHLFSGSFSE